MSKTIIKYANELVDKLGKEEAIKVFEERIKNIGEPKNFDEICKISSWETAILHIKGEINNDIKDLLK